MRLPEVANGLHECQTCLVRWTLSEIATVTSGRLLPSGRLPLAPPPGGALIDRVVQDSRSVLPGSLFVPLKAERDGHDFIPDAVRVGAVAYLVAQTATDAQRSAAARAGTARAIEVEDPQLALVSLSRAARKRLGAAAVIGVTGSVGKTTAKDLIASVLGRCLRVHASSRSFNNEIGVPLTLLSVPDIAPAASSDNSSGAADDLQGVPGEGISDPAEGVGGVDAVVVEMGARGPGHIRHLCDIAGPTMGVITTVGLAHTSEFGSLQAVVKAKRELVECLPSADRGGVAFLNADVPDVAAMAAHTEARVVTYGTRAEADITARDVTLDSDLMPRFTLVSRLETPYRLLVSGASCRVAAENPALEDSAGGAKSRPVVVGDPAAGDPAAETEVEVVLGARGMHAVGNALAAAAVGLTLGVSARDAAIGLSQPRLSPLRMELLRTPSGALLLNDSYNANPLSMRAALRSLASLPCRRRVAVLGVMAELGRHAPAEHAAVATSAEKMGIRVIAVNAPLYTPGRSSDTSAGTGRGGVIHVGGIVEAFDALMSLGSLDADLAVLLKGSRVARLERVADRLLVNG